MPRVPPAAGASGFVAAALAAMAQTGRATVRPAAAEEGGAGGTARAPSAVEIHCSPISPTCARYKAFLAWQKVPAKVVDTLPLGKDGPPRVMANGAEVADLPGLVAQLRSARGGAARAPAPAAAAEEQYWVQWADDKLLPHVFVNVFRSPGEATQAMDTAVGRGDFNVVYSTFLRQIGSYYMYTSAKMAKRKMEVLCAAPISTARSGCTPAMHVDIHGHTLPPTFRVCKRSTAAVSVAAVAAKLLLNTLKVTAATLLLNTLKVCGSHGCHILLQCGSHGCTTPLMP